MAGPAPKSWRSFWRDTFSPQMDVLNPSRLLSLGGGGVGGESKKERERVCFQGCGHFHRVGRTPKTENYPLLPLCILINVGWLNKWALRSEQRLPHITTECLPLAQKTLHTYEGKNSCKVVFFFFLMSDNQKRIQLSEFVEFRSKEHFWVVVIFQSHAVTRGAQESEFWEPLPKLFPTHCCVTWCVSSQF